MSEGVLYLSYLMLQGHGVRGSVLEADDGLQAAGRTGSLVQRRDGLRRLQFLDGFMLPADNGSWR